MPRNYDWLLARAEAADRRAHAQWKALGAPRQGLAFDTWCRATDLVFRLDRRIARELRLTVLRPRIDWQLYVEG